MPAALNPQDPMASGVPIVPSAEAWQAMTEAARERFLDEATLALQRESALTPEGFPHFFNKNRAYNVLRDHFDRVGRGIFPACELPVFYPGVSPFAPDLIAVVDVDSVPARESRRRWVVATENRGILFDGDRQKDLGRNVELFASLGISEYFVYDVLRRRLHGFRRLDGAYREIRPRGTALWSGILGMELDLVEDMLTFSIGGASVPASPERLGRMERIAERLNSRVAEAEASVQAERSRADQALLDLEAERARALAQEARADQALAQLEGERQARLALEAQLAALLAERSNRNG
jgi:hypothetical protein